MLIIRSFVLKSFVLTALALHVSASACSQRSYSSDITETLKELCSTEAVEIAFTAQQSMDSVTFSLGLLIVSSSSSDSRKPNTFGVFSSNMSIDDPIQVFEQYLAKGSTSYSSVNSLDHNKFFITRKTLAVKFQGDITEGQTIYFYIVSLDVLNNAIKDPLLFETISDYQFNLATDTNSVCAFDCSSHGICSSSTGFCECYEGYFDVDCQTSANQLSPGTSLNFKQKVTLSPRSIFLAYLNMTSAAELGYANILIDIQTDKKVDYDATQFYFHTNSQQMYQQQVASYANAVSNVVYSAEFTQTLNISNSVEDMNYYLLYRINYFSGSIATQVEVKMSLLNPYQSNSSQSIILFVCVAAFFVGILLLWIVCQVWISIKIRKQLASSEVNSSVARVPLESDRPAQVIQEQKLPRVTRADLDKYLPIQQFSSALKAKFNENDSCAVCLEEFVVDPKCQVRVTLCQHLFHANCLQEWIEAHENCPMCRQPHSILEIIKIEKPPEILKIDEIDEQEDRYLRKRTVSIMKSINEQISSPTGFQMSSASTTQLQSVMVSPRTPLGQQIMSINDFHENQENPFVSSKHDIQILTSSLPTEQFQTLGNLQRINKKKASLKRSMSLKQDEN